MITIIMCSLIIASLITAIIIYFKRNKINKKHFLWIVSLALFSQFALFSYLLINNDYVEAKLNTMMENGQIKLGSYMMENDETGQPEEAEKYYFESEEHQTRIDFAHYLIYFLFASPFITYFLIYKAAPEVELKERSHYDM